jgi:chromosome segregation ATPase
LALEIELLSTSPSSSGSASRSSSETERLRMMVRKLSDDSDAKECEITSLQQKLSRLEIKQRRSENSAAEKLESLNAELQQQQQRLARLGTQLDAESRVASEKTAECQTLTTQLQASRKSIDSLNIALAQATQQLADERDSRHTAESKNNTLKQKIRELKASITTLESTTTTRALELETQLRQSNAALQKLQAEHNEQKCALDTVCAEPSSLLSECYYANRN